MTRAARSARMSLIRSRDTKPELAVRSAVHRMGFRFALHSKSLPGKPDLVFPARKKVIFVHGCFWHLHRRCCRPPKTRQSYWMPKLKRNAQRDAQVRRKLRDLGWRSLVVWECQLDRPEAVAERIRSFLTNKRV